MPGSENIIDTIEPATSDALALERLRKLSRAGKLAGFEPGGEEGVLASFAAYGNPFDGVVDVRRTGASLRLCLRMPGRMPMIFAAVLVLTVWPGLPLTEGFLQGFGWYERLMSGPVDTWMWYLPVTILPAPFALLGAMNKSRLSASEHARETAQRIRPLLEAGDESA